jgi:7-cyano-7-deazaguanine synthase
MQPSSSPSTSLSAEQLEHALRDEEQRRKNECIALVSGGLDSTTALWWALWQGLRIVKTLHFQYGQSHASEIASAITVCEVARVPKPEVIKLNFEHLRGLTALLPAAGFDSLTAHQTTPDQLGEQVSATYVPGRNIVFLAIAGGYADAVGARHLVGGWNAVDYSGYPDCRPRFLHAMEDALRAGLRWSVQIHAPLVYLSKADIIRLATQLHAPLELTWSCYKGGERPCGECPSCKVRQKGFEEAGIADPALAA